MKENIETDIGYNEALDYSDDVQYANAIFAIGRVETDNGGLTLNQIWEETEWLRRVMLQTPKEKRHLVLDELCRQIRERNKAASEDVERTQMCILTMFALRLIKASETKVDNPNYTLIRAMVKYVSYKAKKDDELMAALKELVQTIDQDGDENEENGMKVEFGVDILAADGDWTPQLWHIVEAYIQKADTAGIIARGKAGEAFDAAWEALVKDDRFAAEARESSLGKNYNLRLIFNVFGLMYPWAYTTKIRGYQGIAKVVGDNPEARGQNKFYSKDYFNSNSISQLQQAIKTDSLLTHICEIINTAKAFYEI